MFSAKTFVYYYYYYYFFFFFIQHFDHLYVSLFVSPSFQSVVAVQVFFSAVNVYTVSSWSRAMIYKKVKKKNEYIIDNAVQTWRSVIGKFY